MHAKIHANEDRFLMSTLWPAWQALIGEGEGGDSSSRARGARSRENLPARRNSAFPFQFQFNFLPDKKYIQFFNILQKR